jgi:hypothetical protein
MHLPSGTAYDIMYAFFHIVNCCIIGQIDGLLILEMNGCAAAIILI